MASPAVNASKSAVCQSPEKEALRGLFLWLHTLAQIKFASQTVDNLVRMLITRSKIVRLLSSSIVALMLVGCDLAALLADPRVAQREAEGKAIGGACRHALRSIEDCYINNSKAQKTAIFEGWKEMDQYMRENKIEGQASKSENPAEPVEEIVVDDKKSKPATAEKTAVNSKPKASDAKPPAKAPEKALSAKGAGS